MDILITIFSLLVLLFSIIIHEIAHGSVAYALGDPTAKMAGRLTLNPISHLDPIGSIMLPLFLMMSGMPIIGWAKPVPINPMLLQDRRWGDLKVSIAGVLANFFIALIFGLIIKYGMDYLPQGFLMIASFVVFYNIALGLFNLIPIPPLDGSHILFSLLPDSFNNLKYFLQQYGFILLMVVVFIIPGGLNWIFNIASFFLEFFSRV
jgi:Zn-dependent protease